MENKLKVGDKLFKTYSNKNQDCHYLGQIVRVTKTLAVDKEGEKYKIDTFNDVVTSFPNYNEFHVTIMRENEKVLELYRKTKLRNKITKKLKDLQSLIDNGNLTEEELVKMLEKIS